MATILGLLLVVTFIANYLATTLPNTMSQNDLQHEQQVENQVAELSALVEAIAQRGAAGAQVSQPVTLGSAAAPPFASSDPGALAPFTNRSGVSVSFDLLGPVLLPTGGTPNTGRASGCTPASPTTQLSCTSSGNVIWNFSAGSSTTYRVTDTASGTVSVNFTTNSSLIVVSTSNSGVNTVVVLGSHDTVYVNTTLASASVVFLLIGSNDTVSFTTTGASTAIAVSLVGDYDSVTSSATGASVVRMSAYGGHDSFDALLTAATVYYTGFNLENPNSGQCPYDNVAANTDTVSGTIGGTVYYNDTNSTHTNTTSGGWNYLYRNLGPLACPYVAGAVVAPTPTATGFVVALENRYAPYAEVAYDQGSVVFAQTGGLPIFIVPPPITLANGVLQLFVPSFRNSVSGEAGSGTADVGLRLLTTTSLTVPSNGFTFSSGTRVTITAVTPYAAAWYSYYHTGNALSSYVTCTGSYNVCNATYSPGGAHPLGTLTFSIPTSGLSLDLLLAQFSVTID